jgi:hypothetical protein
VVRSIIVVTLWIGPVGFEALGLGSRRWGWVRGIDVGFEILGLRRWHWVQGFRVGHGRHRIRVGLRRSGASERRWLAGLRCLLPV